MLFRKVPKGINWFYTLGSATMFAFLNQAVTGVFLAMYYRPDASGWRLRVDPLHHRRRVPGQTRALDAQVGRVGDDHPDLPAHGARVLLRRLQVSAGADLDHRRRAVDPDARDGLQRYLLPFDQQSYWATIVGVNINGTGPFIGPYLSDFLRAGPEFGATTLSRFYAIHMMLIPGLIAGLIGAHLYLITKLGISAPPWLKAVEEEAPELHEIRGLTMAGNPVTSA